MFTGIVETTGLITGADTEDGDLRLRVGSPSVASGVSQGDSVAVNGVCLTVIETDGSEFAADVSRETIRCSTLGELGVGDTVNLEPALKAGAPLGGHIVTGHVDGVGRVTSLVEAGQSWVVSIEVPDDLTRFLAAKGSVCVDGISLTVNEVAGSVFSVNIIPHTREVTTMSGFEAGTRVNIEIDVVARYVERLLAVQGEGREGA